MSYIILSGLAWLGLAASSGLAEEFGRAHLTWGGHTFSEYVRRIHADDPGVRADAALALGSIAQLRPAEGRLAHLSAAIEFPDAAEFASALSDALADKSAAVRKNAVSALAFACLIEMDPARHAEWVRTIFAKLQDPDASVRCNALDALARIRVSFNQRKALPDITAALTKAAQDNDVHVRRRLAAVAWHFAPLETLDALRMLLHDSDDLVMLQSVERVENLGTHAADLKPDLLSVFSKNPHAVLCTLAQVELLDSDAIPAIVDAIHKEPKSLQAGFEALAMLGKPALPALRAMLHMAATRIQALTALRTMDGMDAQDALDEIRVFTHDPNSRISSPAKSAVRSLTLDPQELAANLQSGVEMDIRYALYDFQRRRSVPPSFLPVLMAHFRGVDKTQTHLCREVLSVISRCGPEGGTALAELAQEFEGDIAVFREHFIEAGPHCAAALPLAIKHELWDAVAYMTPIDQLPAMLARTQRHLGGEVNDMLRRGLVVSPKQASAIRRQYDTLRNNENCVDELSELIVRFAPIQEVVEMVAEKDQSTLYYAAWRELSYRAVEALPYFDKLFELGTKVQNDPAARLRELQKAAIDPAYKAFVHEGQWRRHAFGDRNPRDAEKLYTQALEDFERDPLDEDCANELLRLYRRDSPEKMHKTTDFPLAILRAARMRCGVKSQNGNFDGDWYRAMSWAWKAWRPVEGAGDGISSELADAIDDWLLTRRCSDESTSTRAGAALFRQCASGVQPDEKALADLFGFYVEGRTWRDRHITAATILEAAGLLENARREYARAAGHWAYIEPDVYSLELDPGRTPRKVSLEEQRQKGWQGYVRMSIALQRWDDAAQALPMIDAGNRAAFAQQIQARPVPAPVAVQGPWRREGWRWVPEQITEDWQLTRLVKIGNDVLCCTPWDATLLNGASGRAAWNWKPERGGLSYLGNADGRAFFLIDLDRQRPEDREKGVIIGRRNAARNYAVVPVDLRTGSEKNLAVAEIKGEQCHVLPGGGVLTKTGKAWEISFPLTPAKPPVVVASRGDFVGAGNDVLFFSQGERLEVCQLKTGQALWREAPDGPSLPQSIQNLLLELPIGLRSGETVCGQVGTMVYHSFAGAVAVHDSTSGKLLWTYADAVFHVNGMRRQMWPRMTGPFPAGGAGAGGVASVVCLVFPDNGIVGLDAQNGRFLWRVLRFNNEHHVDIAGAVQFAAPVTGGAPALWFSGQRGLLALDPASGRTLWSTLLSPEFNGSFAAFLPPLEINGTIVAAVSNNNHLAGFLLAVRTEPRPANVAEAEAEGFSRADLLRAFNGDDAQGVAMQEAAMQVRALGLAHDPQFREKFKAYALQHGGMSMALLLAAPFEQAEFEKWVFPKLDPRDIGRVGSFFSALYDVATPKQRVELDKIVRPPEPFNDNVTPEDARKMAEKMRDGIAAPPPQNTPVKPPRPPDEF